MYLAKPAKGSRKAQQWERTAQRAKARAAGKVVEPLHRSPLLQVGIRGREQNEWNKDRKREWIARYGKLVCCVTGVEQIEVTKGADSLVVVGHILPRATHPELAQDIDNVAPISSIINDRMRPGSPSYSAKVHEWAERSMRLFVERDRKLR